MLLCKCKSTFIRLVLFVTWSSTDSSADQQSTMFSVVRRGQIPISGMNQLTKVTTNSVFECAQNCWNNGNNAGCDGFLYQPHSCTSNNGSPTRSGVCQSIELIDAESLTYGPATSSCHKFYVSTVPKASKKYTCRNFSM